MNRDLSDLLTSKALIIRQNILKMVGIKKAGHLGGAASIAEIISVLYFHKLGISINNFHQLDRNRLIISKGHAVLAQYAALSELGFFPYEELEKTKTLCGLLQGHPDMSIPGIEAVTGSLGQGLSIALGMALSMRLDGIAKRVYVILGDGELAEGQIWEAAMAVDKFKVNNITAIIDYNKIQSTGRNDDVFKISDLRDKWRSFGWKVIEINGHVINDIISAFDESEKETNKPTLIIADTIKGKGFSFAEDSAAYHNAELSGDLFKMALDELASRAGGLKT